MRFLVLNHLRLGASPAGIPETVDTDRSVFSSRTAWFRAVEHAVEEQVHAVFLTGDIVFRTNPGLEPFGPLVDGIAQLAQAGIPVVAVSDGIFTPTTAKRFRLETSVQFVDSHLDWDPPITLGHDEIEGAAIHIVAASLAESDDVPVANPVTLDAIDHPGSIWILTDPLQPDVIRGKHALVVEPGSSNPLSETETGPHGAWLIDTDEHDATLLPIANLEYAAIAIDMEPAMCDEDVERIIAQALIATANETLPGSGVQTLIVHCTLVGATRVYSTLVDISDELQRNLVLDHEGIAIAISGIDIDATPRIDLEPLVGRPDPVGEVARLINALNNGVTLNESQQQLLKEVEQKLLAVSHARVFGSIVDMPLAADATTLLQRQAWATLDTMVRQRGID